MSVQLSCRVPDELSERIEKIKTDKFTQTHIVVEALTQFFSLDSANNEIQRLTDELQNIQKTLKKNADAAIQSELMLKEHHSSEIQRLNMSHSNEIQKLRTEIHALSDRLKDNDQEFHRISDLLEEKEKRIKDKDESIARLDRQVGELTLRFTTLDPILHTLQTRLMPSREEQKEKGKKWFEFWK
jgi:chromosome segregation ATPase